LTQRRFARPGLRVGALQGRRASNHQKTHTGLGLTQSLLHVARGLRGRSLVAIDLIGIVIAAYLALALRLDRVSAPIQVPVFPLIVILLLSVRSIVNVQLGLYSRRWSYASVPELGRTVGAAALGSLMAMGVFYGTSALSNGTPAAGFPRSFWPIELLLSIAILGGVRFGIRAAADGVTRTGAGAVVDRAPTLLYGAGDAGVLIARSAARYPSAGIRPVGFLDDDPDLAGATIAGLRVYGGLGSMADAVAAAGARTLLITMPSASGQAVRRVVAAALELQLDVRTVPPVTDLLDGTVDAHRIRRVRVEDLLRRPIVTDHAAGVEELIRDRVVMVTGGGGSIGSELARQLYAIGPRRIVLVDRAESSLYLVERELQAQRKRGKGSGELRVHLANVASRSLMTRIVADEAPSVIFHAAAYKHVPLLEDHPSDAAHVNVGGTLVLLEAAEAAGVERFVFVSTDKAVRPSSVMGASKRIGEMLVADAARRTGRAFVSVRFGNVLGSTGSVVPIFQSQLENGEPLTITHPDMTRFFMTIPEAAWLILDAAALGQDGDLFVLDMGQPIRVMDLAYDLVRLSGRDPNSQPIETIGLRPGEKLHEELFYSVESAEPTASTKVLRTSSSSPPETVRDDVRGMLALASGDRDDELRRALLGYVGNHNDRLPPVDGRHSDGPTVVSVTPEARAAAGMSSDATMA